MAKEDETPRTNPADIAALLFPDIAVKGVGSFHPTMISRMPPLVRMFRDPT
jgi:hypothetical protein